MKKSLIALAVAGALTVPMVAQADATLYGSLRLKVESMDDTDLNVADNASRIGIKGAVDTNMDGVKAIYHGEWKVGNDDKAGFGDGRLAYVGLTGGFGTAAIGQQWTPHYSFVTGATDIMDGNSSAITQEFFRLGNMIAYISPDMGGFQFAAGILADSDAGSGVLAQNDEDIDAYNVAAKFSAGGFTAALSHLGVESVDDADVSGLSLAYEGGPFYVALLVQDFDKYDEKAYELAASYSFGDTMLLANMNKIDDADAYGIEVQQKLGKQSRVFVNYMVANDDAEDADWARDGLSAGMRVDF